MMRLPDDGDDDTREADLGRSCDNCGAHVSRKYHRTFKINGQLRACPECADRRGVGSSEAIKRALDD